jgi:hypothetical protein
MLYAKQVIISAENNGGYIASSDYVEGVSGFIIRWNGNVEFNNGKFRGRIEADSGYFHGRIEADEGYFNNAYINAITIEAGPLQVKPAGTSYSLSYNSGASISTILNDIYARTGKGYPISIDTTSGTHNGKSVIGIYGVRTDFPLPNPPGGYTTIYSMSIFYSDGTSSAHSGTLSGALSFTFEYGDIVFKLVNLPTSDPHISGVVWRDGTTLKISTG